MQERFLARAWKEVQQELEAEGTSYEVTETHSPRSFFPTDKAQTCVLRIQKQGTLCLVTTAAAPQLSAAAAAYEESLR